MRIVSWLFAFMLVAGGALAQTTTQPLPPPLLTESSAKSADPTELTTRAVDRAKTDLKELFDQRFLSGEKRIEKLESGLENRPSQIVKEIEHLSTLMDEKFKGVDQQFAGRDIALAAALQAQKLSVDDQRKSDALSATKSEVAITKQIDGIQVQLALSAKGLEDKIGNAEQRNNDLASRVQAIESRSQGANDNWVFISGAILLGFAIVGGVLGLTRHVDHRPIVVNGNGKAH